MISICEIAAKLGDRTGHDACWPPSQVSILYNQVWERSFFEATGVFLEQSSTLPPHTHFWLTGELAAAGLTPMTQGSEGTDLNCSFTSLKQQADGLRLPALFFVLQSWAQVLRWQASLFYCPLALAPPPHVFSVLPLLLSFSLPCALLSFPSPGHPSPL